MSMSLSKHAVTRKLERPQLKDKSSELYLEIDESKEFMRELKIDGLDYFLKAWGVNSLNLLIEEAL